MLGQPRPAEIDQEGNTYTFEKAVAKTSRGDGFADVWMRRHFAWEYKGKHKDLCAAYQQPLQYREDLENPPLLVVCIGSRDLKHDDASVLTFNTLCGAPYDVFFSVINSAGNQVVFSTFLGPGTATGIALDSSGNTYVTGITSSDSFPVLSGVEATSQSTVNFTGGWKSFVSELDPSGKLLFSTYFEGEAGSESMAIAVDSKKRIYIAGLSGGGDFPILHPIPSQTYTPCCGYFAARIMPSNTPQLSLAPRLSPTLTLRNVSSVPLLISSIVATSNFTQGGDCSSTIAAGQGCTLILAGAADGKASGSVSITSNASPATQTFKILKPKTGDTVGAVVIINPASLTYPAQLVSYASAVQPVRVRNVGLQPSTLNSIVISGDFTQTNDCPAVLSPATFCTISVAYKPSAAGQSSGSLDITHDATDDSVYLSGTGSSSAIALSTPVLNFGNQWVGASPLARVVNLTNTTPYPASVTGISTTTGFSETDTCTAPLSPQSSCRAAVTFNLGTNVNAVGTLTANAYGPRGAQSVNLSGTGLISADLSVNPIALSFPQAFLGMKTNPHTVNVTNTTTNTISISTVKTAVPFSQTNNCVGSLAASASCQIQAYFTPTQVNPVTGSVQINFVGNGSPQVIGLSGYAVTKIYLTPNPLVFAQQLVGTHAQAGFEIENLSGNQSFTISSITVQGSDFSLVSNNCPSKLQPYYGCGVQIGFTPSATGARTGTITVIASDSAQPHVAQLQGTGVGAGQVSLFASSLTFGSQTVGTTSTAKNVKSTNTGSGTLNLAQLLLHLLFS